MKSQGLRFLAAVFILLASCIAMAAAETKRTMHWQNVVDHFLAGRTVDAVKAAELCSATDVFCAKYIEIHLMPMFGDINVRSRIESLRERFGTEYEVALKNGVADAIALDAWQKLNLNHSSEPNFNENLKLLDPLLEYDHDLAWYLAGYLRSYENNSIYSRDGLPYLIKASELGVLDAMVKVAGLYACRKCAGQPNDQQAYLWLNQAIVLGFAPAMTEMGAWLRIGYVWPKNVQQAEAYLKQAEKAGDANALCELGKMAQLGDGMAIDVKRAVELYQEGLKLGGNRCAKYLAQVYEFNDLPRKGDENELTYYKECAMTGRIDCAREWARESLYIDSSLSLKDNPGVAALSELSKYDEDSARVLGVFYLYRSEEGTKQLSFDALQRASLMGSHKAAYQMISLLMEHQDEFDSKELDKLPEFINKALTQKTQKKLVYTLADSYLKGTYFDKDVEIAQQWLWASLYTATDSQRLRLLNLIESRDSFIDDEDLKWAFRALIGNETDSQAKIHHYLGRLYRGHDQQKTVAYREFSKLLPKTSNKSIENVALALVHSSDVHDGQFSVEKFERYAQAALESNKGEVNPEYYYWLGSIAHLNKFKIKNQKLAVSLLERSDHHGYSYLARLYLSTSYGLLNEQRGLAILEKLMNADKNYSGSFYRELAGYGKSLNRLDLADYFYQKALLAGDFRSRIELEKLFSLLKESIGSPYRDKLYNAINAVENASELPDVEALKIFYAANRFERMAINDKEMLSHVIRIYDQLLDHNNSKIKILVNEAYSELYYMDNAIVKADPFKERLHLLHCERQNICLEESTFRLAVNFVEVFPKDFQKAKSLIEENEPKSPKSLQYLLKYHAVKNDKESWWRTMYSSKLFKRDQRFFMYLARYRPKTVTRDEVWEQLYLIEGSVEYQVYALRVLMNDESLLPVNEQEKEQMRLMISGTEYEDGKTASYLLGGEK